MLHDGAPGSCSLTNPSLPFAVSQHRLFNEHLVSASSNPALAMRRKKHTEKEVHADLVSIVSVRLREGYSIREVNITKGDSAALRAGDSDRTLFSAAWRKAQCLPSQQRGGIVEEEAIFPKFCFHKQLPAAGLPSIVWLCTCQAYPLWLCLGRDSQ